MKLIVAKLNQMVLFITAALLASCWISCAGENKNLSETRKDDGLTAIINPLNSTCHDWRGNVIPCEFKGPYAEILVGKQVPSPRFLDNKDGTITDSLTKLVWLKNLNCFGMLDWHSAALAVKGLKDGGCGPDPKLSLSDGSKAGDWRLPTMAELCSLIDFSRREPALPEGHFFTNVPVGFHWSATALDNQSGLAWIVYLESGTTCYENKMSHAGHVWPVRKLPR